MEHGDKKMKRMKKMGGSMSMMRKDKKHGGTHSSMYKEGGEVHSGSQPVYGNTVETSMPVAGAN
tara:strand:+ start:602 stop:793 length:192 start_codon:yes stop_codon:yes gene_type:complete